MTQPNQSELREIHERLHGRQRTHEEVARHARWTRSELANVLAEDEMLFQGELLTFIQAHTNAEIARTLDRIASKKNIYVKHAEYVTELNEPPLVITTDYKYMIDLGALQAERAKLKEVK